MYLAFKGKKELTFIFFHVTKGGKLITLRILKQSYENNAVIAPKIIQSKILEWVKRSPYLCINTIFWL